MKRRILRLLTVLTVALLTVTAMAVAASAESASGSSIDSYSIYAGTHTNSAGTKTPGWQTGVVGDVSACPRSIKLWQGDNGLWLNFEYYHDPYAIKPLEIRLRADKWSGIATVQNGRIVASANYFAGSESERLIADLGDRYGWHHISVKVDQDVTVEGGKLKYAWSATFSIDGGAPVTFAGDPACLGIGAATGTAPVWKLYDAALSPDGSSVDFERATPAPSTNTYLRFYFYGGGFYNNDPSERSLLRIRNVRSYYGDAAETVYGLTLVLGGGRLTSNGTVNAVCDVSGGYTATPYHQSYSTYEYLHFARTGESAPTLPTPEREGYVFTGWYVDEACTERVESLSALTASRTLYAGWKPTKTVVSYELDGGSFESGADYPTTLEFGSTSITLPDPKRTNHEFLGWLVNGSGEPVKGTVPYTSTESDPRVTLTAVWHRLRGTVTFRAPSELTLSGTATTDFEVDVGTDIVFPTVSGDGFAGWYLTEDYSGERITSYRTSSDTPDLVFYAKHETVFADYGFTSDAFPSIRFYGDAAADGVAAVRDGALYWKVVDGKCSSDMALGMKPKHDTLILETAIKGSVETTANRVRLRLRASGTSNDTNFLGFTGAEIKIGTQTLATLSPDAYTAIRLVITFVSGGISVDGYANGLLVVKDEFISSALTPTDSDPDTVECARFNWYVDVSSQMELYFDYFYISEGSTPKYTA